MITLDLINEILFWICLYVLLCNGYFLLFNKGVPNIKTAPAIRKALIEHILKDIAAKQNAPYEIIDLGCGNGKFSRQLARAIPNAHIIGIEIDRIAHLKSRLMQKLTRTKNLTHIRADFMTHDISSASTILIYLTKDEMEIVGQKLKNECAPNTLITSNRFKLAAEWKPAKTLTIKTLDPTQGTVYLYRA